MASIAVIDYKRGNLASVRRGLEDAGHDAFVTSDPEQIAAAEGLVLPGVGSFADAMGSLNDLGLVEAIRSRVYAGVPFLGICLGLQLIFEQGDEGSLDGNPVDGLGFIPGSIVRMPAMTDDGRKLKVPHVGWNSVEFQQEDNPLFEGIEDGTYFYFTHSFIGVPANQEDIAGITCHAQPFACSVHRANVFATQFHPEKSSDKGLQVLKNFGRIVEQGLWSGDLPWPAE